jgi:hypothetical protein
MLLMITLTSGCSGANLFTPTPSPTITDLAAAGPEGPGAVDCYAYDDLELTVCDQVAMFQMNFANEKPLPRIQVCDQLAMSRLEPGKEPDLGCEAWPDQNRTVEKLGDPKTPHRSALVTTFDPITKKPTAKWIFHSPGVNSNAGTKRNTVVTQKLIYLDGKPSKVEVTTVVPVKKGPHEVTVKTYDYADYPEKLPFDV